MLEQRIWKKTRCQISFSSGRYCWCFRNSISSQNWNLCHQYHLRRKRGTTLKNITLGQIAAFLWEIYQVCAIAILTGMLVGLLVSYIWLLGKRCMTIPNFNPHWHKKDWRTEKRQRNGTHLGWKWSRLRAQYISYFPYCAKCGMLAEEVHHIHPRSTHPHLIYSWNNLLSLCKDCHRKEHDGDATEGNHTIPL